MKPVELFFESELTATPAQAWEWITSLKGILQEMWPYFRMTAPAGVDNIGSIKVLPGQPLFRSWVLLFGLLPIDRSDLTLIEITPGEGFVEQSPMASMKRWRHERRIITRGGGCTVTDRLTFEPKLAAPLVAWFIRTVFTHRHQVLRRNLMAV
jgi:ligand-binding SRPBCC domain-containing protein